jgi:hypothetical protein
MQHLGTIDITSYSSQCSCGKGVLLMLCQKGISINCLVGTAFQCGGSQLVYQGTKAFDADLFDCFGALVVGVQKQQTEIGSS